MLNFIKENLFLFFLIFILIVSPSLFVGAIQVFAIIILVILLIIMIGVLVIRWRFRQVLNNQQGGYNDEQEYQDGKIKVKVFKTGGNASGEGSATDKKVSDKVGDYVDFEEIKE